MLMHISEIEKRLFEEKIHLLNEMDLEKWSSICFTDKHFRLVLIKAMNNLIKESSPSFNQTWTESLLLDDQNAAKDAIKKMLLELAQINTGTHEIKSYKQKTCESKNFKGYSTGQLATFFSVSTTTINNWINEGRFLRKFEDGSMDKVKRNTPNEKLKIHPDFWYDAPSGVRYQVKEAVEAYENDLNEWEESKKSSTVSEQEQIQSYLVHFRKKYDGKDFITVFGNRDWNTLKSQEELDAAMWSFFLQRISSEKY
jgi:hypothetical protein